MRILIVSPTYYPSFYPRAYRWTAIAEEFASRGIVVDLVTTKSPGRDNQEVLNKVNIHRVSYASLDQFSFSKNKQRRVISGTIGKPSSTSTIKAFLQKVIRRIWRFFYWPDGAIVWYPKANALITNLLKANEYQAVFTVSNPFTSHLLGINCVKKFPNMLWIADVGDPFSLLSEMPLNNSFLYKKLNKIIEGRVFQRATNITCTVEETRALYLNEFPEIDGKIVVIPPLATKESIDLILQNKYFPEDSDKVKLCYIGGFYKTIREPTKFLQLLRILKGQDPAVSELLKVYFFGSTSDEMMDLFKGFSDINDMFKIMGGVPREDIPGIMHHCDILINIANTTGYQLPSKSVDYMKSGKPIINICHTSQDSFKKFLASYPICFNIVMNESPTTRDANTFHEIVLNYSEYTVDESLVQELTDDYSITAVSDQYLNLIYQRF